MEAYVLYRHFSFIFRTFHCYMVVLSHRSSLLRFVVYGLTSQRDYSKHWFYYAIAAYGIPMFTTSALVIGGTQARSARIAIISLSLSR